MNETLETLLNRASVRSFNGKPVEDEKLQLIIQAGLKAPSAMNRQTPRFVVVKTPELMKKLSAMNAAVMGASNDPFYGAPQCVIVLGSTKGLPVQDCSLALGNMFNAAFALGVGSCWINRAKEMFESEEGKALLKEWGIEEDVVGVGICILGYTDAQPGPKEIIPGRVFYAD